MEIYELFLPVTNPQATAVPAEVFQHVVDELSDHFGYVDTRAVYRPMQIIGDEVAEDEFIRFRFDVPNMVDNHVWLVRWRTTQTPQFGEQIWMIHYRHS